MCLFCCLLKKLFVDKSNKNSVSIINQSIEYIILFHMLCVCCLEPKCCLTRESSATAGVWRNLSFFQEKSKNLSMEKLSYQKGEKNDSFRLVKSGNKNGVADAQSLPRDSEKIYNSGGRRPKRSRSVIRWPSLHKLQSSVVSFSRQMTQKRSLPGGGGDLNPMSVSVIEYGSGVGDARKSDSSVIFCFLFRFCCF